MPEDYRSPLAKARDEWIESNRDKIEKWAIEANANFLYIENRLSLAFVDGAAAQETIDRDTKES